MAVLTRVPGSWFNTIPPSLLEWNCLPVKEDLLQNIYKRTWLIGSRVLRRIETLYKIITSWGQEIFWAWYRKMLSCEDLTAATWPEQLGKRTVVGFSSSHRGTAGYSRTELLLCLAAGGAAFRYLTHEYNWIVTVEMLLAFAALGNSAAPGTSARAHVS